MSGTAGTPEPFDRPFAAYRSAPAGAQSNRAVGYRRESDQSAMGAKRRGETRGTWEKQLEDAEQYAEEHGLELVADYLEAEQGDVWARPALQRMLADMRAGTFHHIIIWHPDRLSRDDEVKALFRRELRACNVKLHYVHFKVDDTPEGQLSEDAAGMVAKYEKKRIRQRTQTMRQERAKSGTKIIAGGTPLWGYQWVRDERFRIVTYELDPDCARYAEEVPRAWRTASRRSTSFVTSTRVACRRAARSCGAKACSRHGRRRASRTTGPATCWRPSRSRPTTPAGT
jgi:DNA invertase Pin-like site-specific DNA recombinase